VLTYYVRAIGTIITPVAIVSRSFIFVSMQTLCIAHDPANVADDLKDGCTGAIKQNDLLVKGFANADPPKALHIRCGKREWEKEVRRRREARLDFFWSIVVSKARKESE